MKKKAILLWSIFAICVVVTIALWFAMKNAKPEYEEVEVEVISAVAKQVKNKKTASTYNFYEVKVEYNGLTYDLENAHDTYSYPKGKKVKAYLSNDRLFANVEGVQTSTHIATIYFIFLFGSFIMLFVASMNTGKKAKTE